MHGNLVFSVGKKSHKENRTETCIGGQVAQLEVEMKGNDRFQNTTNDAEVKTVISERYDFLWKYIEKVTR